MCKGADSVIEKRLANTHYNQKMLKKTSEIIKEYAKDGLRTLFLAERELK
jgi:magnesium-transporting ATPase (P-type)